jgi:Leucine-rich repeat (LRR) protein
MLNLAGVYNYYDDTNYYISGDINKPLMELQQLKYLEYLNLSSNDFKGTNIPIFFGSLRNLRYVDLSYCNFGGQIPIQFEALLHLKYLNLFFNHLSGLIPHQLGDLSNLQFLNLGYNHLEGSIPSQVGNLSNLQYLHLLGNSLNGKIPSQLGKLKNLQKLYLGGYGDSTLTIDNENHSGGQWLSNLTSLTRLHMLSIYIILIDIIACCKWLLIYQY